MYENLDSLLIDAIKSRKNPLYDFAASAEAKRIASETGRESCRVIDSRLQALRRKRKIIWLAKREALNGLGGWTAHE